MIIWGVACFMATFLIIFLVVVQYPYKFTSYLALSFVALIDGLWLYGVIIPFCRVKEKPKTISKPLVFWLCMVLYCCFVAAGFLTDAYIASANTVVLVFDCIFAAMGLAAVVGLGYQFVVYIALKICLRYGKDATAEFTESLIFWILIMRIDPIERTDFGQIDLIASFLSFDAFRRCRSRSGKNFCVAVSRFSDYRNRNDVNIAVFLRFLDASFDNQRIVCKHLVSVEFKHDFSRNAFARRE